MIHRFWTGDPRQGEDYKPALEELHDQKVTDWTPETLPAELQPLCGYTTDPRRTSNLVRYALLARYGGLWVDHDVEALQNLMQNPMPWTASLGGRRQGCAMWFPQPNHQMMVQALMTSLKTPDLPGAVVLDTLARRYRDVLPEPRVLPYDTAGRSTGISEPLANHHWETSSR